MQRRCSKSTLEHPTGRQHCAMLLCTPQMVHWHSVPCRLPWSMILLLSGLSLNQFFSSWRRTIQKLFFISDGPTMQYRGKKNFYLLSTIPFQMGFTAVNWSFLEADHGKGPADGAGATIQRTADSQVARGTDIPTASSHQNQAPLRWGRTDIQSKCTPSKRADHHQRYTEHSSGDLHYAWHSPL